MTSRLRTVRVDPYAPCDIAREYSLTANQTWLLALLALQAEFRSDEWPGTLADLASAARCSRKTAAKDVAVLVAKGLLEEIEPFRSGTDGRVRVLVRARIVLRPRNASNDANEDGPDRDPLATTSRIPRDRNVQGDANDQGEHGGREALRQRGGEEESGGSLCKHCHEPMAGHVFGDDHEAEAAMTE